MGTMLCSLRQCIPPKCIVIIIILDRPGQKMRKIKTDHTTLILVILINQTASLACLIPPPNTQLKLNYTTVCKCILLQFLSLSVTIQ